MPASWRPFPEASASVARLRLTLLVATLMGLGLSAPLWVNERFFPLLPVARWFPVLGSPWDKLLFGGAIVCLALAWRWYRPAIGGFLGTSLLLYLGDQNRGQPWFYIYCVLLLLTLFPEKVALNGCRIALAAVYVWSGVQKFNPKFFASVAPWFVSPARVWGLPPAAMTLLQWAVDTAPVVELVIGLGVWIPPLRRPVLAAAVIVHASALLFLGPLGHNMNFVVWPWNLAMLALLFTLFPAAPAPRFTTAAVELGKSRLAALVTAAFCLLPILGLAGRWDKYFSFALYSGNQATADIFLAKDIPERLPERMRPFAREVREQFNPELQGPFVFDYISWGMKELGAPPLIEPRSFRALYHFVRRYATNETEVRLLMSPRKGSLVFLQGDKEFVLHPPTE